jgi:hypothetical protein
MLISWDDFEKVDIRVGTILEVNDFPKAKKPAYQLKIDFGTLGTMLSSARITIKKNWWAARWWLWLIFRPNKFLFFSVNAWCWACIMKTKK